MSMTSKEYQEIIVRLQAISSLMAEIKAATELLQKEMEKIRSQFGLSKR
jgi:prefoldin subunit 5